MKRSSPPVVEPSFACDTLIVAGLGLLGASVASAAKRCKVARRIIGWARRQETRAEALRRRFITETLDDPSVAPPADLMVICTPVESIASTLEAFAPTLRTRSIVTDVGSTKASIVAACEKVLENSKGVFVGSHPMAGGEKSGLKHARGDLFFDRTAIVTPTAQTPAAATRVVAKFWSVLGARVIQLSPAEHDARVAMISHMPHVIAAAVAAATPENCLPLAGAGWRDTTRIAAGDAELWRQILIDNRQHVLAALDAFDARSAEFRAALTDEDDRRLKRLLERGKKRRDALGN